MTAQETLARQYRRALTTLFRAAHSLPADKIDWSPAPGMRSTLDQLQEIATCVDYFWEGHASRKVTWSPEIHAAWLKDRAQFDTLEAVEAKINSSSERLIEFILAAPTEDLGLPVEMPFPGDFLLADILGYYAWNVAYHEGQISYIKFLLDAESFASA